MKNRIARARWLLIHILSSPSSPYPPCKQPRKQNVPGVHPCCPLRTMATRLLSRHDGTWVRNGQSQTTIEWIEAAFFGPRVSVCLFGGKGGKHKEETIRCSMYVHSTYHHIRITQVTISGWQTGCFHGSPRKMDFQGFPNVLVSSP